MRAPRFKIKKFVKGRYSFFGIHVPAFINVSGKGGYYYYHSKQEAERGRGELLAALTSEKRLRLLSNAQQDDALRALDLLEQSGVTMSLCSVVQLALPLLAAQGRNMALATLLEDFAAAKAPGWSAASVRNFKAASALMLERFADVPVAEISGRLLQGWLTERFASSPGYLMNTVRTLRPAFNFAVRQGIIAESPFQRLELVRLRAADSIDIFSPEEARRLMEVAPLDCRPAFALLLFAGVRPAELTRLVWGNVRDGFVHIAPGVAKTRQVRNIEIVPTLAAWLRVAGPHAPEQLVCPPNWKRKSQAVRAAAGLADRQDTARHSYASYHLALFQSVDALKANLGHSRNSDTLFAHYRAAATPAQAKEYWAILPG